ncbi:MAG: hypothetical protein WC205_19455 [Opitutaceae bacterium]
MLSPKIESWSLVIPGSWNRQILTPAWLGGAGEVTTSQDIGVEVAIDDITAPRRILFEELILEVASARLVLKPQTINDEVLKRIQNIATKILEKLPHTPIRGLGVNFAYRESEPTDKLKALFNFTDSTSVAAEEWTVQSSTVQRELVKNNQVLNFRASYMRDNSVEFLANYHFEAKSSRAAIEALVFDIISLKNETPLLLNKLYS